MLAEGKMEDTGASESFRVCESDYILKQKGNEREIFFSGISRLKRRDGKKSRNRRMLSEYRKATCDNHRKT